MINIEDSIFNVLKTCLSRYEQDFLPLHAPTFQGNEWAYVKECIDTTWVSSVGKFVDRFEQDISDFTHVKHTVATVNGTAALHMCLHVAGVQAGEEVLTPALTFVATTNSISYCQAIPHFVDSNQHTLGVDAKKLADYLADITEIKQGVCYNKHTQRPIRALIIMHVFGHPVELDEILAICQKYNITLIEDAAEALGSYYKGQHVGHHGLLSTLSFNGNKVITTGGGGAILTNDTKLAQRVKHLTTTAKVPHSWEFNHDEVAYNYRLPNINAALGCAQLEQLDDFLVKKRQLADTYQHAFKDIKGVSCIIEPKNTKSNYWLNALCLDSNNLMLRDKILKITNEQGIMTRPIWTLQNKLPMYKECPSMSLDTALLLEKCIINIPSSVM